MPLYLIVDLLPLAAAVALSPVPVVAVLLLLGTDRPRATGSAFALGWLAGLLAVGGAVVALATESGVQDDDDTHPVVAAVMVVLGLALLVVAAVKWRGRRGGAAAAPPSWLAALEGAGPGRAFGLGLGLSGLNPKSLALSLTASALIAEASLSSRGEVAALLLFAGLSSGTAAGPVVAFLVLGERARPAFDRATRFVTAHSAAAVAAVSLLLGVKLLVDGLSAL